MILVLLVRPSANPVTIDPPIEPRPPITTIAKVLMMTLSPIVGSTFWFGAARTPPRAATATPPANVIETSLRVSIPSARADRRPFEHVPHRDAHDGRDADDEEAVGGERRKAKVDDSVEAGRRRVR